MEKLILPAGKPNKQQSSGNKFYRALLLILSVLDWESKFVCLCVACLRATHRQARRQVSSRHKSQVIASTMPKFTTQRV